MSKKRVLLVSGLIILIALTVIFFIYSSINKDVPSTQSDEIKTRQTILPKTDTSKTTETPKNELEALPADNTAAIESELSNIDEEINSATDVDLEDLSDIENDL
ncbi:MAG: hypothetical protein ACD_11C00018G0041 [uncultured bacterium]|nr:MAG: hypothetical protein ACD_11C00018G0041 [uncultured bacterium]HBR71566.1 hypothetical protein [Candidatus Moranbacteria bacterium]